MTEAEPLFEVWLTSTSTLGYKLPTTCAIPPDMRKLLDSKPPARGPFSASVALAVLDFYKSRNPECSYEIHPYKESPYENLPHHRIRG